ncbi:MAG: 4-hydroxy-tetrahydrodipicolinate reductase [Muribaculaceae bacterium]|nr:4-hydroxy-tetrahydrodipicolinate reductase [Muribaculaceae bacterium]
MKVALIGHGRMGRLIETILKERGLSVSCIIDEHDQELFDSREFRESDVAIEFTTPATAVDNILHCFAAGVPVVCGTTGWTDSLPELKKMCEEGKGTLLYASNFSVGVNIFRAVNRYLARIMNDFAEYIPSMEETHHIHKLDHPSGTAITLAEEIVEASERLNGWKEPIPGEKPLEDMLEVAHVRRGEVPGIHEIKWDSDADTITLVHSAKSRRGFASGAVMAAEWLAGKKGFFTISDVLASKTQGLF